MSHAHSITTLFLLSLSSFVRSDDDDDDDDQPRLGWTARPDDRVLLYTDLTTAGAARATCVPSLNGAVAGIQPRAYCSISPYAYHGTPSVQISVYKLPLCSLGFVNPQRSFMST